MSPSAAPSRRALLRAAVATGLAASGLVALTACAPGPGSWSDLRVQPLDGDPAPPPREPDADELARRAAVEAVSGVLAAARAATAPADRPDLAALLAALVAAQQEQLAALEPSGSPAGSDASGAPAATATLDALPAALTAAAATARGLLPGVSGGEARLLACLAAGDGTAATALASALGQPVPPPPAGWAALGGTGPVEDVEAEALATALDRERAAVYGYGVAAARLDGAARERALEHLGAHDRAAEALAARLTGSGREAPAGAPGWALPFPVTDQASALALGVAVEESAAAAAADLVAVAGAGDREGAAALLDERARRATAWRAEAGRGAELVALPGLSGR